MTVRDKHKNRICKLLHPVYILSGIFIGYIIGSFFAPFVCQPLLDNNKLFEEKFRHTQNDTMFEKPKKTLYVAVMTAGKFLKTRATACNNTWGRYFTVQYFAQTGNWNDDRLDVINLPGKRKSQFQI